MKENYETPNVELIEFETEDIIVTSGCELDLTCTSETGGGMY